MATGVECVITQMDAFMGRRPIKKFDTRLLHIGRQVDFLGKCGPINIWIFCKLFTLFLLLIYHVQSKVILYLPLL